MILIFYYDNPVVPDATIPAAIQIEEQDPLVIGPAAVRDAMSPAAIQSEERDPPGIAQAGNASVHTAGAMQGEMKLMKKYPL